MADLRDPFSFGYMWRWPSPLHHRAMQRLEGWALRGADRIIVNTPTALATYRRLYSDISGERWWVLPNGFDPDDFPERSQEKRSSERLTIVYTGSLAGYTPEEIEAARRKGRKGARFLSFQSGTCDPTTRSGYFLLQGVARALEAEPALRRMLRIDLIGKIDPRNERLARSLGIEDVVSFHAPIPHDEALRRAAAADLLFLPLEQGVAGERTPYIPGKAYEYLAMRKPVLLLAGDSDTREILERAGLAFPTPPDDPEAIAARIVELHRTFRQVGTIPVSPDEAYIERFRADRQAETFCAILREAEGGEAVEFPATPVTLEGKK
ncbi:MAG: glycosyltransferase [Deltaproteobacteria bacterium]|nr:MAG: glycosyltransferase [Deltaproteobacteria bacterium]